MNIITHALIGWCAGNRISRQPAEVAVVAAASLVPDIDAAGALVDLVRGGEAELFSAFHHKFGHCLPFCLLLTIFVWRWRKNASLALWCAALFHLHLLGDIVGARGPDGYQWPIYYFFPFSEYALVWSSQWEINAWPNLVLTVLLIFLFLRQVAVAGFSPLVFLSRTADEKLVMTLRRRFKTPDQAGVSGADNRGGLS